MLLSFTDTQDWKDPRISYFKKLYPFLAHIDSNKVQLYLNMYCNNFDDIVVNKDIFIVSTFTEAPRNEQLVRVAEQNPSTHFICLADVNFYDSPLPPNITFFKYRHWYIPIEILIQKHLDQVIPVKSKVITKKFSSLSHRRRQARAIITSCLLTYAPDQSIISWYNLPDSEHHDYLIDSVKTNSKFSHLNWELLNHVYLTDNYFENRSVTYDHDGVTNFLRGGYQSSLINFSNETTNFGLYQVGDVSYTRPGPFLSEKTWNPLVSGNVLFASGAPLTYDYLINDYNIPINYSIDTSFDYALGDVDRFELICKEIIRLVDIPLADLIDQNIDNCELIQKTITDPGYLDQFYQFNQDQSDKILDIINKTIS